MVSTGSSAGRLRRSLIAVLASACAGCAAHIPPVPVTAFQAGDLEVVRGYYAEQFEDGDLQSQALFLNGLAQTDMLLGRYRDARLQFETAGRIMGNWATSSGEVYAALLGQEGSKTWKGDPHEKAMNAFYTGLLYWIEGQPDNARAAFKKGLLADGESDEGEAQRDFALLSWLAGRASLAMGLAEDARQFFADARQAREFAVEHGARGLRSAPLLEHPAFGNVILLADIGLGPIKTAAGEYGDLAVTLPRDPRVQGVRYRLDGEPLGRGTLLVDLNYQATTRGGRTMEGIRGGKAVFKKATETSGAVLLASGLSSGDSKTRTAKLIAGGSLLLFSFLTRPEADIRHWTTLPDSVHVLAAEIPPGAHELQVEFLGRRGRVLQELTQYWTIEVRDTGQSLFWFRSLPGLDRVSDADVRTEAGEEMYP